ncbi:MAG TPA: serine/threonine-protein kinase [Gemmataceae bacterium]|nr:serine/threonine-protein kinase [Gemmataceae bacterium]
MNRYRAIRLLGEGGMGRAYLARPLDGDRLVVVKVLQQKYATASHYREAIRREIDLLSQFRHPGVVELYEASMDDPQGPCLVMEYVQGEPPDALLERHGRLEPKRVGRLLGHLCGVLQAAHDRGIIHRDLKPANILVVEADTPSERVKVLDFGLARLTVASPEGLYIPLDQFTGVRANAVVGTPEYTCPEVLRGDPVDHRGDLYSIGVLLYELLTGHRPFDGATIRDILSAHAVQPPPPFGQWGTASDIPPAVETVVQACLAKDPVDRPQSARDLACRYGEACGQPIWHEQERAESAAPISVPCSAVGEESDDPDTVTYHLEAWMPESVAAVKLRGFLDAAGGEAVESVPGRVRVCLRWRSIVRPVAPARGLWPLLGFGKPAAVLAFDRAQMDVHFQKAAAASGRLNLTVQLRGVEGIPPEAAAEWRDWCDRLHRELKAYLMAQT